MEGWQAGGCAVPMRTDDKKGMMQQGSETSQTVHAGQLCRNSCGKVAIQKGKRPKEFCSNRCRAAFRDELQQQAIREAMARIEQLRGGMEEMTAAISAQAEAFAGALEQFGASMAGAVEMLKRFEKKKRTGPRG